VSFCYILPSHSLLFIPYHSSFFHYIWYLTLGVIALIWTYIKNKKGHKITVGKKHESIFNVMLWMIKKSTMWVGCVCLCLGFSLHWSSQENRNYLICLWTKLMNKQTTTCFLTLYYSYPLFGSSTLGCIIILRYV